MSIWGLVMAKARATFTMSDLKDPKEIKGKYTKILYIGVMIVFA